MAVASKSKKELLEFLAAKGESCEGTKADLVIRAERILAKQVQLGTKEQPLEKSGTSSVDNRPKGQPTEETRLQKDNEDERYELESRLSSRSASKYSRHSSCRSSLSSVKAKILTKKAALLAETRMQEESNNLELEELQLKQKRRQLDMKTRLAMAEAEERVITEMEEQEGPVIEDNEVNVDKTRKKVEQWLNPEVESWHPKTQDIPETETKSRASDEGVQEGVNRTLAQVIETMNLPKTEMPKFSGDPLDYWNFISTFEETVGSKSVSEGTKLTHLLNLCQGEAYESIKCCTIGTKPGRYERARKILHDRYGDDHVIVNSWLQSLTSGQAIKHRDARGMQKLADDLQSCIITFEAMGKLAELDNKNSMKMLIERLPNSVKSRWMSKVIETLEKTGDYPNIRELSRFVSRISRELNDPVYESQGTKLVPDHSKGGNWKAERRPTATTRSFKTESDHDRVCSFCDQNHNENACKTFKELSPLERLKTARNKKLCFKCLSPKHFSGKCKANVCDIQGCKGQHSRLLHESFMTRKQGSQTQKEETKKTETKESHNPSSSFASTSKMTTSCPIVKVHVASPSGTTRITTYAMLDACSDQSYCSTELMKKLGMSGVKESLEVITMTGKATCGSSVINLVAFADGVNKRGPAVQINDVHAVENFPVVKTASVSKGELKAWSHMKGIGLETSDRLSDVNLLIGMNNGDTLIPLEVRKGGPGEPFAVRYQLGWTINGRRDVGRPSCFFISNKELYEEVQKFWSLDVTGSESATAMSVEDRKVLQLWEKSTTMRDGHYILDIPFRRDPPELPNNKPMAEARLAMLKRRFFRNPKLHQQYVNSMNDLFDKGYAEEVQHPEDRTPYDWYLPHHGVTNPRKPGKLRIVFDCAAAYNDESLNKIVMQGPDLTNHLLGVLMKFRENPVAVCGDVEAMFNQVYVKDQHRDALRFLWYPGGDVCKDPVTYRMTTHLFGGCWSPAAANYALKRCAKDNGANFPPEVTRSVERNFYVDDCLKSLHSETEAIEFVTGISKLLAEGGFKIRKWASNSREILSVVPREDMSESLRNMNPEEGELPSEGTLGISWNPQTDELSVRTVVNNKPLTRRGLLSVLGSVFDPLGILAPVVLSGKLLFQKEVRTKKGWDEPLAPDVKTKWKTWIDELPVLNDFTVPRCLKPITFENLKAVNLHLFSDASENAYGCVAYMQVLAANNDVHCSFLLGKTRLAPLKTQTIPRLELCAAVLAVKVSETIKSELDVKFDETTYWTDSKIVLCYINNSQKRFKTFVANRVARILETSNPNQWNHVPTEMNPADDATRGMSPRELMDRSRWIHGPEFLWLLETPNPKGLVSVEEGVELEVHKSSASVKAVLSENAEPDHCFTKRFSSWSSLRLSIAWILRYMKYLKEKRKCPSGEITVKELQEAEKRLIMYIQSRYFAKEMKYLASGTLVAKSSPLYRLNPILNEGILRVRGRVPLENAPAILPRNHWTSTLLLRHYHKLSLHAGREHVIALCLQRYWILGIRGIMKKLSCVQCKKRDGTPLEQKMADLSPDRTTAGYPPFTFIGIDCFGPFTVKRGRSEIKHYGCLFTCLTIRAVHVELLPSMETDSFLNALQRFISIRGAPKAIRCDNGSNFVGAEREITTRLKELDHLKIERSLRDSEIKWIFNPPKASCAGGAWERMIRAVRKSLFSALKEHSIRLDEDGLRTALCLAAAAVNSRPLTTVSTDPKDLQPLTPNDLILLRKTDYSLPGCFEENDLYRRQYRRVQYLANLFWRRWTREYLPALQERHKWHETCQNLKEEDIVMVLDDLPRNQWIMGRVVEVFRGRDGLVRTVKVKTASTELIRPVRKLCLLEGKEPPKCI